VCVHMYISLYVCMYIYIYICMYVYLYTHTHAHTRIHTHAHTHNYICVLPRSCACVLQGLHICIQTSKTLIEFKIMEYLRTYMQVHVLVRIQGYYTCYMLYAYYTHVRTYTQLRTHMKHTHTHMQNTKSIGFGSGISRVLCTYSKTLLKRRYQG
jgi:hypothetical protein